MKIINKIFRATKKDGSLEKVMSKLPENPDGYSGVFTNLDQSFMDRALKGLSECDEDMHPAMFIPMSYFFIKTPMRAKEELDIEIQQGKTLFDKFVQESFDGVQQWVYWNSDLANELFDLCPGVEKISIDSESIRVDKLYITPQIEDNFLNNSNGDNAYKIKRMKMLAAVNILLLQEPLKATIHKNDASLSAYYMFLFCRSLSQFSANRVVDIGLSTLEAARKGGRAARDRKGLQTFVADYHSRFPSKTDRELWGIIKSEMSQKKFAKPCPGYSITFCNDYVNEDILSGTLIQKNEAGLEYPIQFKAVTAMRGQLRK